MARLNDVRTSTCKCRDSASPEQIESFTHPRLGKPSPKPWLDGLDLLAAMIAVLCFVASVLVIDVHYPFAAELGYPNQIVAIGFLLGVMNQCLQRILPYLFLLVEAQYGQSHLQNYEGLLRWSPLAPRFSWVWRTILVLLLILPLGLGVLYKNFEGGMAHRVREVSSEMTYYPTGPPGMQENINGQIIVANATAPFLSATSDNVSLSADFYKSTHAYGFNIALLSNTSAVALDGPTPERITALQRTLAPQASFVLKAHVRGTVVSYNETLDYHRNDETYWEQYDSAGNGIHLFRVNSRKNLGYYFAILARGLATSTDPKEWDDSWMFVGVSAFNGVNTSDLSVGSAYWKMFHTIVSRYDARRHNCTGTWQISQNSVQLLEAECETEPLPTEYQYYTDCQLDLLDFYAQFMGQTLGDFGHLRNESHWRVPTYCVVLAAVYQTKIAINEGFVPVRVGGPTWQSFPENIQKNEEFPNLSGYYEKYNSSEYLTLRVPTIRALPTLYCALAIQPVLTVLALCATTLLYQTPVARTFGIVSMLAGVDRRTLDILKGAAFSGELFQSVGMRIDTIKKEQGPDHSAEGHTVIYSIGDTGLSGKVRSKRLYE